MNRATWQERLQRLSVRLPEYGMSADLSALSIAELWSLYRLLQRMTGG
jgi:hypothetical protein